MPDKPKPTAANAASLKGAVAAMQAAIKALDSDPNATSETKAAGHALSGKVTGFSAMWGT